MPKSWQFGRIGVLACFLATIVVERTRCDECVDYKNDCKSTEDRCKGYTGYNGTKNVSQFGTTCRPWSGYSKFSGQPENYCRNPDDWEFGAWCYTDASEEWELCFDDCPGGTVEIGTTAILNPTKELPPTLLDETVDCSEDNEIFSFKDREGLPIRYKEIPGYGCKGAVLELWTEKMLIGCLQKCQNAGTECIGAVYSQEHAKCSLKSSSCLAVESDDRNIYMKCPLAATTMECSFEYHHDMDCEPLGHFHHENGTIEDCQATCNRLPSCYGIVVHNISIALVNCFLKDWTRCEDRGKWQATAGIDLYIKHCSSISTLSAFQSPTTSSQAAAALTTSSVVCHFVHLPDTDCYVGNTGWLDTTTGEECLVACRESPTTCDAFSFTASTSRCWLKTYRKCEPSTLVTSLDTDLYVWNCELLMTSTTETISTSAPLCDYVRYHDTDCGTMYREELQSVAVQDCKAGCLQRPNCEAFSFVNSRCWLKTGEDCLPSTYHPNIGVDLYVRNCEELMMTSAEKMIATGHVSTSSLCDYVRYQDTDCGTMYREELQSVTVQDCKAGCLQRPNCEAFSFVNSRCWLKTGEDCLPSTYHPNIGVDLYVRNCPPIPTMEMTISTYSSSKPSPNKTTLIEFHDPTSISTTAPAVPRTLISPTAPAVPTAWISVPASVPMTITTANNQICFIRHIDQDCSPGDYTHYNSPNSTICMSGCREDDKCEVFVHFNGQCYLKTRKFCQLKSVPGVDSYERRNCSDFGASVSSDSSLDEQQQCYTYFPGKDHCSGHFDLTNQLIPSPIDCMASCSRNIECSSAVFQLDVNRCFLKACQIKSQNDMIIRTDFPFDSYVKGCSETSEICTCSSFSRSTSTTTTTSTVPLMKSTEVATVSTAKPPCFKKVTKRITHCLQPVINSFSNPSGNIEVCMEACNASCVMVTISSGKCWIYNGTECAAGSWLVYFYMKTFCNDTTEPLPSSILPQETATAMTTSYTKSSTTKGRIRETTKRLICGKKEAG